MTAPPLTPHDGHALLGLTGLVDPFAGAGAVGRVARSLGRVAWLIEREPTYWPRLQAIVAPGVRAV